MASSQERSDNVHAKASDKEDESLCRRGNAGLRHDVQEMKRIYDPVLETEWGLKYRNFSDGRMRTAYKTFAEARHDPFNKSPAWISSILRKIAKRFDEQGTTAQEAFKSIDDGSGMLHRTEIRRLLISTVSDLGDSEISVIFDALDEHHTGEIALVELNKLWSKMVTSTPRGQGSGQRTKASRHKLAGYSPRVAPTAGNRGSAGDGAGLDAEDDGFHHRSPVHRVKRLGPAQVDGWDHLSRPPLYKHESDLLKDRDGAMFKRIGAELCLSPRKKGDSPAVNDKYKNFNGGGGNDRFDVYRWRSCSESLKSMNEIEAASARSDMTAMTVPDPGGFDIRPGYHIDLARMAPHLTSPSSTRRQM